MKSHGNRWLRQFEADTGWQSRERIPVHPVKSMRAVEDCGGPFYRYVQDAHQPRLDRGKNTRARCERQKRARMKRKTRTPRRARA